jgi:hypothetical protein
LTFIDTFTFLFIGGFVWIIFLSIYYIMTEISNKKDRTQYYKDYAIKNKDKLKQDFICDECGGKFKLANKTNHNNTKKHINCLTIKKLKKDNEMMKNIISDVHKKIDNI